MAATTPGGVLPTRHFDTSVISSIIGMGWREGIRFLAANLFHFPRTRVLIVCMGQTRVGTHCQVTAAPFPAPRQPGTARALWHGPPAVVAARSCGVGT